MTTPGRILIIRLSSLGDILHTIPAFCSLRKTFPHAVIDWLVEDRTSFVLAAVPGISNVLVIDTRALRKFPWRLEGWKRNLRTIRLMRSKRYDLAVDFQGLLKSSILALLSGARTRIGLSRELARERAACLFYNLTLPKPHAQLHIVDQNQKQAELAGAQRLDLPVDLQSPKGEDDAVAQLLSRWNIHDFVVINPGGGWYTKRWNPVKYGVLARRIRAELGLQVVVTTGPGEESLYGQIAAIAGEGCSVHLALPFLALIPLFRRARLVIGGDTGPFHLACALRTPAVGIFGPTSPARNGPWTSRDEAVVRVMPCSYCNGRTCPTQNECMDISVDEVFEAVVRRLGKEVERSSE